MNCGWHVMEISLPKVIQSIPHILPNEMRMNKKKTIANEKKLQKFKHLNKCQSRMYGMHLLIFDLS